MLKKMNNKYEKENLNVTPHRENMAKEA